MFLLITPSFVILAQNEGTQQDQPTIVATVNESEITGQELWQATQLGQVFQTCMMSVRGQCQQCGFPQRFVQFLYGEEQGKKFRLDYKMYVLDSLIDRELQSQKIEDMGITASEEEVEKTVDQQIKSTIESNKKYETEEDLKKAYESQGNQSYEAAKDNLRKQVKQSILHNKLREKITSGVQVTEKEMKTFYEENKESYKEDGTIKPFEEVKDQVKNTVLQQKKNQAWNKWLQEVKEEANIEKNSEAVETLGM